MLNERLTWNELPEHITDWVQGTMGARVLTAESQPNGFSLGTADRLTFGNQKRAFLKAIDQAEQPDTAKLHRAEIKALAVLATSPETPELIASYDNKGWVAMLLEDIIGAHPHSPWQDAELKAAFTAIDRLAQRELEPHHTLASLEEDIKEEMLFWDQLADQENLSNKYLQHRDHELYHEFLSYLPLIQNKATTFASYVRANALPSLAGNHMVHTDLRADNLLIRTNDARAVIIDWPWACAGNPVFDAASLAMSALQESSTLTMQEIRPHSKILGDTAQEVNLGIVLAMTGYYIKTAQQAPHSATKSTLPEFRFLSALKLLRWVTREPYLQPQMTQEKHESSRTVCSQP